ncbi:primase alpha helix C-terminal domain-containing protein [Hymenobacter fodinae]|uniref:Primase C-terminal 1 domain-containing protein n=1 Tax=Hymenobacter fodinae TaxID=2510796 RepID=A0A4Z0P178_9BACT|nr:primase alpha helix C-terminal domain-containing protein [Hymenobacter fodinae]TGE04783.1 hypothetical protein EU556_21620 [Hymenobacter fodinae]
MFGFDNTIYEHLQVNRDPQTGKTSVAGFPGSYYAEYLHFDIDRQGDLPGSLASSRDLVQRLYRCFQLSPSNLLICFSGSKGFHIGLHQSHFGGSAPSPQLPTQINVLAARLLAECYELSQEQLQVKSREARAQKPAQEFADVDLSIYNNRIFWVLNSRNKKGRYKVGLTSTELLTLPLEDILAQADAPRPDYRPEGRLIVAAPSPEQQAMWEYARTFDTQAFDRANRPGKGSTGTTGGIDRDFFAPPQEGSRDNTLFKQTCHLFDHSDLYETQILQLIDLINRGSERPLPDEDIRRIVRSAFTRTQRNKAQAAASVLTDGNSKGEVEIWGDWTEEWLDYYTQKSEPMTCLLPEIDADQEGSLKGKLGVFIGSGGTRKSFFVQNLIVANVLGYSHRFIPPVHLLQYGDGQARGREPLSRHVLSAAGERACQPLPAAAGPPEQGAHPPAPAASAPIGDQRCCAAAGAKSPRTTSRTFRTPSASTARWMRWSSTGCRQLEGRLRKPRSSAATRLN